MAKDPVCGMQVDEQQAVSNGLTSEHGGQKYYFCSASCKQSFEREPERYTREQADQR